MTIEQVNTLLTVIQKQLSEIEELKSQIEQERLSDSEFRERQDEYYYDAVARADELEERLQFIESEFSYEREGLIVQIEETQSLYKKLYDENRKLKSTLTDLTDSYGSDA